MSPPGGSNGRSRTCVLLAIAIIGLAPFVYPGRDLVEDADRRLEVPPSLDFDWVIRQNYTDVLFDRGFLGFIDQLDHRHGLSVAIAMSSGRRPRTRSRGSLPGTESLGDRRS